MDTQKMHRTNFPLRLRNILFYPKQEWQNIAKENTTSSSLFWNWALPLILIMALASIFGELVVNQQEATNSHYLFVSVISTIILSIASLYLSAQVVKFLATNAISGNRFDAAFRLICYSYSAGFAANILAFLFPSFSFISIFGLYSFYLLWIGMGPILNIPKDKISGYFTFILIALIAIYVVLGLSLVSIINLYTTH